MAQDRNGDIWFGTNGSGVFKFEIGSNSIVSFSKEDGFQSERISSVCIDANNNIWFGTDNGIVIYRSSKQMGEKGAFMLLSKKDGLAADAVVSMDLNDDNTMVVGSEFDGVTVIQNTHKLT
jgi:ligand-binding sensor domain-containing protein